MGNSVKQRERPYVKVYVFFIICKYDKKLIDTATKTGTGTLETASKRVV